MSETLNRANANRDVYTMRPSSKNGVWVVGNDQTDPPPVQRGGITSFSFRIAGKPHVNARQLANAALYGPGERALAEDNAVLLAATNTKVTVLRIGDAGYVTVVEGTLVVNDGRAILKSKGSSTRGHYVEGYGIVAIELGYGKGQQLVSEYNHRAATVPSVGYPALTDIPELEEADENEPITAVFLINSHDFGNGPTAGCLFLVTNIQTGDTAENSIVNGFFWAPDGTDVTSEHSSMYFRDIDNLGGRIYNYDPGALTFEGVMNDQLGTTREEAYAVLTASQK